MFAAINNAITSMDEIFVIALSVAFFEKLPKTYPIIKTMQATNRILVKIIEKNII